MKTRVQKWGNSLALRIPKSFAAELGLQNDSTVEISFSDGKLVVALVTPSKPTLKQLLARVTDENLHGEVNTGQPAGNEIW
jgi:antitoxin MazE